MQVIANYIWLAIVGTFVALVITYVQVARLLTRHLLALMKQELLDISMSMNEARHALRSFDVVSEQLIHLRDVMAHLEMRKRILEEYLDSKSVRLGIFVYAMTTGVWQHLKFTRARKKAKK
jgi:heme exporter protein D